MDSAITDEILEELSSVLQRVEAQSTAILELMKEKGIAKDEELALYLQRANEASSVRWRATRVRLEHLLSGLAKHDQQSKDERAEKEEDKEKHEHIERAQQNTADKAQPKQLAKPDSAEQSPAGQKSKSSDDKRNQSQLPQTVESSKTDLSGTHAGEEPESPQKEQEQSKTATSKISEKPPDKSDRRAA